MCIRDRTGRVPSNSTIVPAGYVFSTGYSNATWSINSAYKDSIRVMDKRSGEGCISFVVTRNREMCIRDRRWQKVADEAVKQCRRGVIPQVSRPMKLREMIDKLEDFDMVLFPYENERGITIKDVLRGDRAEECGNCEAAKNSDAAEDIAVIIGPEGGFSDPVSYTHLSSRTRTATSRKSYSR